jgi:glycosyltransferase involved in cell wall biosynthesis
VTGNHQKTLVHVTTIPETLVFLQGQISFMKERGFAVHVVSSPGPMLEKVGHREGVPVHGVSMERRISPLADVRSICSLFFLFRKLRPTLLHAHTPKGGLLGVLAGRMTGAKSVVYTLHGLRYATAKGWRRKLLQSAEAMTCGLADRVFAVSLANQRQAVADGICPEGRIRLLARGSCNGVDSLGRFNPEKLKPSLRAETRRKFRIPDSGVVLGYVGRIVRDKGITELWEAWCSLKDQNPEIYLLIVGPIEEQDPLPCSVMARLTADERVRMVGWADDPVPFYAAMDVFVLPTYREGFPISPLEAAAMELPVIASRVDGCVEAVADGMTGLLVPPRDSKALAEALQRLILKPELRERMGRAGRQRVLSDFRPEVIWEELYQSYLDLLKVRGVEPRAREGVPH